MRNDVSEVMVCGTSVFVNRQRATGRCREDTGTHERGSRKDDREPMQS